MRIRYYLSLITLLALPTVALAVEQLNPPFGTPAQLQEPVYIIAAIVQALLGVVGASTLLVFIWGGFMMIFSNGNEEKITKGRSTLLWAVIGLTIILSSYSILQYTFNVLARASAGGAFAPTTTAPAKK